jgi:hypothetical protein
MALHVPLNNCFLLATVPGAASQFGTGFTMKSAHFRYFTAVGEELSFQRAWDACMYLYLAFATRSMREVLKRNSTRVQLTEAAGIFLLEPEKALASARGQRPDPTSLTAAGESSSLNRHSLPVDLSIFYRRVSARFFPLSEVTACISRESNKSEVYGDGRPDKIDGHLSVGAPLQSKRSRQGFPIVLVVVQVITGVLYDVDSRNHLTDSLLGLPDSFNEDRDYCF